MAPAKHPHASKSPPPLPPEHRRANPTTYHVEVEELMAVAGAMAVVRVDPKEHLASAADDLVQTLAQMKCPSDYPPRLTMKYLPHSGRSSQSRRSPCPYKLLGSTPHHVGGSRATPNQSRRHHSPKGNRWCVVMNSLLLCFK